MLVHPFLDDVDVSGAVRVDTDTGEVWFFQKGPDGQLLRSDNGEFLLEKRTGKVRLALNTDDDPENAKTIVELFLRDGYGEKIVHVDED